MLHHRFYPAAAPRRAATHTARLGVERLEGRCVPAAFLVTTVADSGPGSLRAAIQAADADPNPSTITFDPGLNGLAIAAPVGGQPLPAITANGLTIQGPGPDSLTVAGGKNGPVLFVASGVSGVTISGLTITGGGSGLGGFGITSGGGISNAGALALVGCVVTDNGILSEGFAASGGGIENSGTMTITGCAVTGNGVSGKTGAYGAGIDNRGQMTITDSIISGNIAYSLFVTAAGGGINNSGNLALFRCTVNGNQLRPGVLAAASGGGVTAMASSVTTITDCTITGNSSTTGGGVQTLGGSLSLAGCTVAQNTGGGIALSGGAPAVGLQNTIVAGNSGGDVSGAVQSGGDNLVGDPAGATGLQPSDRTNIDPLLGPLQANGGLTPTMALLPGSPAIDAGSNAAPGLPATDQRGLNRVVNNVVDIGAFEYQPPGNTITLTAAPDPGVRGRPVTFTVTVAGTAPGSNAPTGVVTFQSAGTSLAGGALLSGGTATFTTSVLPAGDHLVTAVYQGDVDFTGGTTASVSVRVNLPPPVSAGMFDPSTATWYLRSSNSAGPPDAGQFRFGTAGSIPVKGDWVGTGADPIGVFDPSSATWYLRNETSAGPPDAGQFQFGGVGWLPVTGDWGGSGHSGVGVFDPSTATWYLRSSLTAGPPDVGVFQYGVVGSRPVAGDWVGSGRAGIGVFDAATFTWYLRGEPSAGAPDAGQFAYGGADWLPVTGAFATPQSLLAAGGEGPGAAAIGPDQLQSAVVAALARLSASGVDPALVSSLASAAYGLGALPPGMLGEAAAGRVTLSADAAGRGWFIDPTPSRDEEFAPGGPGSPLVALPGSPAAGREDLLTAVLHEMGHLAGNPDSGSGLMAASLAAGTRDTLALDHVFSTAAPGL
jgi:hypothetical protein